ncbi:MAG: MCP four helix bundle domain-containing protein, partial [Trichlorobacter sp.]|nr:MCP four helix bundle domain-containing protein [Trichlorobacter sp.]
MKRIFVFLVSLSLKVKLLGGLALMLISLMLVGSTALYYFNNLESIIRQKNSQNLAAVMLLHETRLQLHMLGYDMHQVNLVNDPDEREELLKQMLTRGKSLEKEMLAIVSLLQSAEDKQWLVQFHTAFEACRMPARQFVDALSKSDLHRV